MRGCIQTTYIPDVLAPSYLLKETKVLACLDVLFPGVEAHLTSLPTWVPDVWQNTTYSSACMIPTDNTKVIYTLDPGDTQVHNPMSCFP